MPRSMKQPDREDSKKYFIEYCEDQVSKVKSEMIKLNKRLDKLERARRIYNETFGKKLTLDSTEWNSYNRVSVETGRKIKWLQL